MADPNVLDRMRADWNERARLDANYYVAFGRLAQDEEEFFATAGHVVQALEAELARVGGRGLALEIGCGPGRLMRPMSRHFAEIHGVDVSDEMVRLARERLRETPHARVYATGGSDLAPFGDNTFDFAYSYAVFQHIPSREVVFRYLEEARRVLKPGGVLRCQINGLPPTAQPYTTWEGVRISGEELAAFARDRGFQLLALEGLHTQYMWATLRKPPEGWPASLAWREGAAIRNVTNAYTGESAVPTSGPHAAISLWIENLVPESDLNRLEVAAEGRLCRPSYLGPPDHAGVAQLNAELPAGLRTGLVPVEVRLLGKPVCGPGWIRLIAPGPRVPRLTALSDGVNLVAAARTSSGMFKASLAEVTAPETFGATLDGRAVRNLESFCTDPLHGRFEFNFEVPEDTAPGGHELRIHMGRRVVAVVPVEVS